MEGDKGPRCEAFVFVTSALPPPPGPSSHLTARRGQTLKYQGGGEESSRTKADSVQADVSLQWGLTVLEPFPAWGRGCAAAAGHVHAPHISVPSEGNHSTTLD